MTKLVNLNKKSQTQTNINTNTNTNKDKDTDTNKDKDTDTLTNCMFVLRPPLSTKKLITLDNFPFQIEIIDQKMKVTGDLTSIGERRSEHAADILFTQSFL